jgi:hypothetical protein
MKKIFLTLSIFFSIFSFAQDSTAAKKPRKILFKPLSEYAGDTISPAGPNEIAVNIAPIFTTVLGGYPDNEARFSVFYKRSLKNPRAVLRVGIMFKPEILGTKQIVDQHLYFEQTDSTRTDNIYNFTKKNPWQLNLGFEWRSKGGRRWSTYLSFDVITGLYSQKYSLKDVKQKLDSTGNWVSDFQAMAGVEMVNVRSSAFNWYIGGSPNFGVRYAFNKRWAASVQTGVDFFVLFGETYTRDSMATNLILNKSTTFNSEAPALLNEFAITYRF